MGKMSPHDDNLRKVEEHWNREVAAGGDFTRPALYLTQEIVRNFAAGKIAQLPGIEDSLDPRWLLQGASGNDVLCLASGGGQQTAVFGLLGAKVSSLDLCEGQLEADRQAARHYGYEIRTVKGDAADLSALENASFDLVYQANSIAWMPDVRPVYREVHRVLRPGGLYRVAHNNPAVHPVWFEGGPNGWDGVGYRIAGRYRGGPVLRNADGVENMEAGEPTGDHRHLLGDIFGGLIELGFIFREVAEDSRHFRDPKNAPPGGWEHMHTTVGLTLNITVEKS